jgi:hypothetical protein
MAVGIAAAAPGAAYNPAEEHRWLLLPLLPSGDSAFDELPIPSLIPVDDVYRVPRCKWRRAAEGTECSSRYRPFVLAAEVSGIV